jgi:hypothetical protein
MKTYRLNYETWEKVYEHLGGPNNGGAINGATDAFLLSEYGLKINEKADPADEEWEYEITDEELLTLFLLRWS